MRTRDEPSTKAWILKCSFHANRVYCHFLLEFARSGVVPETYRAYIRAESEQSIRAMTSLLKDPRFRVAEEQLHE
jgi:hypothetical protein